VETALEHILTSVYKDEMICYMASTPEAFEELVRLAIADKQPYSWRAAWLLWSCMEKNDQRVQGYIQTIIEAIPGKKDGHQRELIKILYNMELSEDCQGPVFCICVDLWEAIHKKPSVRMNAFYMILKIAKQHPDLCREIELLTQNHYLETLSPGIKYSVSRLIKTISR